MKLITKWVFFVYTIVTLIIGLPLLLLPGRFLGMFNWAPVDPLISRLLGAALIAISWTAFFNFLKPETDQIRISVMENFVFCSLGALGIIRHLLAAQYYPFMVWFIFLMLTVFAILWGVIWLMIIKKRIQ